MPGEAALELLQPSHNVHRRRVSRTVTTALNVGGGCLQLRVQDIRNGHRNPSKRNDGDALDSLAREGFQAEAVEFHAILMGEDDGGLLSHAALQPLQHLPIHAKQCEVVAGRDEVVRPTHIGLAHGL